MLVPLFAYKGVAVMGVRPVALGREQLAVGIIAVVVSALALVLIISLPLACYLRRARRE